MSDTTQRLEEAANDFIVPLRLGDGFNEESFQSLCEAVRAFNEEWRSEKVLPKAGVLVLIDLPRMVDACHTLYQAEERQRVIDSSMELVDVILEGFAET